MMPMHRLDNVSFNLTPLVFFPPRPASTAPRHVYVIVSCQQSASGISYHGNHVLLLSNRLKDDVLNHYCVNCVLQNNNLSTTEPKARLKGSQINRHVLERLFCRQALLIVSLRPVEFV